MIAITGFSLPGLQMIALNISARSWQVLTPQPDLGTVLNGPADLCHHLIPNIMSKGLCGRVRSFFASAKNVQTGLKPLINKPYNLKITPKRSKSWFGLSRSSGPVQGRSDPASGLNVKNIYSNRRVTI